MGVYEDILISRQRNKKILAVLLDPEKTSFTQLPFIAEQLTEGHINYVFVGGSGYKQHIDDFIIALKKLTTAKVLLFPGDISQFSPAADALLFLSVITSKDAEMLVGQHIKVALNIKQSGIETIPMGYILVNGGKQSTVEKISHTQPLDNSSDIISVAVAAELLGKQLVYLEAGSGALKPVDINIVHSVRTNIDCPLIVGGGIKTIERMCDTFEAGADIVVIGNYFEQHIEEISAFGKAVMHFNDLKKLKI